MERDYNELFKKAAHIEPRQGFEQMIMDRIHSIEKRRLNIKRALYVGFSALSLAGTVGSVIYVIKALSASGAYQYVSLLFSDIETLSYFKEFALSVAESLPFMKLAIACAILAIFIWSLLKTLTSYGYKEIYRSQVA